MCGGTIEFNQGDTVGVCDSCGTKQTLPRIDDEKRANLYDRADHYRRANDYDKAIGIYEQILNEDATDAEAYWSLVLCKYGIEYVEDPLTHKRIPTVNRAQYRVFFSRITLEDKLGTEYEPYIFAALNSAKVMLAFGTKYDYYNAVWVKNEWSRFLKLMAKDKSKHLIPCYKDIDAYDMPKEFAKLQAQDMGKVGAIQDLVRGITKIIEPEKPIAKEVIINAGGAVNVDIILERGYIALEDCEWSKADDFFENVLNQDPKCAKAYLGKMLAELKISRVEELVNANDSFENNNNYTKASRYDDALKAQLESYILEIENRKINARLEAEYQKANNMMSLARNSVSLYDAAKIFDSIIDYKDSAMLKEQSLLKADEFAKNESYMSAKDEMSIGAICNFEKAIEIFNKIAGWKDSEEQIIICQQNIENIKAKEEQDRFERRRQEEIKAKEQEEAKKKAKKAKLILGIAAGIVAVIVVALIYVLVVAPKLNYDKAEKMMAAGNGYEAYVLYDKLGDYKDSKEKIKSAFVCLQDEFYNFLDNGNIEEAYNIAVSVNGINVGDSYGLFCDLKDYKDARKLAEESKKEYVDKVLKKAQKGDYIRFGNNENNNEWYVMDKEDSCILIVSKDINDVMCFDNSGERTWKDSTLRSWLNGDYLQRDFSDNEINLLVEKEFKASYFTNDNALTERTQDKVNLLTMEEYIKYLENVDFQEYSADTEEFWLVTAGYKGLRKTVDCSGQINQVGHTTSSSFGVRPVLMVDLSKVE